jgi:hypothetical protein
VNPVSLDRLASWDGWQRVQESRRLEKPDLGILNNINTAGRQDLSHAMRQVGIAVNRPILEMFGMNPGRRDYIRVFSA